MLDLPLSLTEYKLAVFAGGIKEKNAFDVLSQGEQRFFSTLLVKALETTYNGLRNTLAERGSTIQKVNQVFKQLTPLTKAMVENVPSDKKWAFPLTFAKAWTVVDLVLTAHKGIEYSQKRTDTFSQPNYYPGLLRLFEDPKLKLSAMETEVFADICMAFGRAGGQEHVFKTAQEIAIALPTTKLGARQAIPEKFGYDFADTLLSGSYTNPA